MRPDATPSTIRIIPAKLIIRAPLQCASPIGKRASASNRASRRGSMLQNLGQEKLRALRARLAEEIVLFRVLDDQTLVHEYDAVCDLARKAHLVRDNHHGHAF